MIRRALAVFVGLHAGSAVLVCALIGFALLAKGNPMDIVLLAVFIVVGLGLGTAVAFKAGAWLYRYLNEPNQA